MFVSGTLVVIQQRQAGKGIQQILDGQSLNVRASEPVDNTHRFTLVPAPASDSDWCAVLRWNTRLSFTQILS